MKYLLDTHMALWALQGKRKLPKSVSKITDDVSASLFLSVASAWEVAIKVNLGKLDFEGGVAKFLDEVKLNRVEIIGIEGSYISAVETLPLLHRDPFDRLLVATAITEGMIILTIDENIHKYNVNCIG